MLSETLHTLVELVQPGTIAELRIPKAGPRGTISGYFTDLHKMALEAERWSGQVPAVYATLNPVKPELLERVRNRAFENSHSATSDADILYRAWLPIDCDPVREGVISSTDAEHAAALKRIHEIRDFLRSLQWPDPLLADSGNGGHADYRISLLAESTLVEQVLKVLAAKFDDNLVKVDTTLYNASRVCKVYGTMACKGVSTPERPHRMSVILEMPAPDLLVTEPLLEELVGMTTRAKRKSNGSAVTSPSPIPDPVPVPVPVSVPVKTSGGFLETWLTKHQDKLPPLGPAKVWKSTGWKRLFQYCPWTEDHDHKSAFIAQQPNGAIVAGCLGNRCKDKGWDALKELVGDQVTGRSFDIQALLLKTKEGTPRACLANVIILLREHPDWQGVLGYNEFSLYTNTRKKTPWQKPAGQQWVDNDDTLTADWLQHNGIMVSSNLAGEAVQAIARENSYHPVKDYLKSIRRDHTCRLDTWLIKYVGAEDTPYIRAIGARWLISAVARIFQPGCKADHTLLLEGPQGAQKSTVLQVLASKEWFTDHTSDLGGKESRQELHGKWIVEMAELDKVRRGDLNRIKSFLTTQVDHYRVPYAHRPEDVPRTNVFAGSVNDSDSLTDETGGRRFWPVLCGKLDIDRLQRDRDSLWAEAYERYQDGVPWWLDTKELDVLAEAEQELRYNAGVWDDVILAWLEEPEQSYDNSTNPATAIKPFDSTIGQTTITDILLHAIKKPLDRITQPDMNQVARCLVHARWKRTRIRTGKILKWFYVRPAEKPKLTEPGK